MMKRRLLALVLAAVALLAGLAATAGSAGAAPQPAGSVAAGRGSDMLCQLVPIGVTRDACLAAGGVVDPTNPGGIAGGLVDTSRSIFSSFTPAGIIDSWAAETAKASAEMLVGMQAMMLTVTGPQFDGRWFVMRYGLMFGLGLVVMAFVLIVVISRMTAGTDEDRRPEMLLVMREAGASAVFFVPAVLILPSLVFMLTRFSYDLAGVFGSMASKDSAGAVDWYVHLLAEAPTPDSVVIGGSLSLFAFAALTFIGAFTGTIEMAISQYGLPLILLLGPVLMALGVNPRWRKAALVAFNVMVALMLVPVIIFFCYWVLWGMVTNLSAAAGPADAFAGLLLVTVGSLAAIAIPVIIAVVLALMGANGTHLEAPSLRMNQAAISTRNRFRQQVTRLSSRAAPAPAGGGGGGGGGGGAGSSGDASAAGGAAPPGGARAAAAGAAGGRRVPANAARAGAAGAGVARGAAAGPAGAVAGGVGAVVKPAIAPGGPAPTHINGRRGRRNGRPG